MKKQILFADGGASFDVPMGRYIEPVLNRDDLEGMRALTYIEPVKATNNRLYLRGWGNCGTSTQNAALNLLKRLAGGAYKDAYYGEGNLVGQPLKKTTGEYIRLKDSCSDIGFLIDYRQAVVDLYAKVKSLPAGDDSDQANEDRFVYYSVPIPTRGGRMAYSVPADDKAWQERHDRENEVALNDSNTKKEIEKNETEQEAENARQEELKLEQEKNKNKTTFYKVIRYAALAVIAAFVIFLIVKIAKKKK